MCQDFFGEDFNKVLNNPGCACNVPFYRKVFQYKDRLKEYFPNRSIKTPEEEAEELSQNYWSVTNCHVDELEKVLNKMHRIGRKQVAITRYEDQITLVVNDIGVVF